MHTLSFKSMKRWIPLVSVTLVAVYVFVVNLRDRTVHRSSSLQLPLYTHSPLWNDLAIAASEAVEKAKTAHWIEHRFRPDGEARSRRLVEANSLQEYLSCSAQRGAFHQDDEGVTQSQGSKYSWAVDEACKGTAVHARLGSGGGTLCGRLAGKRLVLVGDRVQYGLHDHLLATLSSSHDASELARHPCMGADFCNWHTICSADSSPPPVPEPDAQSETPFELKSNSRDQSSFRHHHETHKRSPDVYNGPLVNYSNLSKSTILRYVPSSSLLFTLKRSDRRLNEPHLSSATDIRDTESFWKYWVSASDIIILSKAPVSAPKWSWDEPTIADATLSFRASDAASEYSSSGFLVRPVRDRVWTSAFQNLSSGLLQRAYDLNENDRPLWVSGWASTAEDVVSAALYATLAVWLPNTLRTLDGLGEEFEFGAKVDVEKSQKIFIWRGEWLAPAAECGLKAKGARETGNGRCRRKRATFALEDILGLQETAAGYRGRLKDPWRAFHNVQGKRNARVIRSLLLGLLSGSDRRLVASTVRTVVFQTLILEALLPYFDIAFLPHHMQLTALHALDPSINPNLQMRKEDRQAVAARHLDGPFMSALERILEWKSSLRDRN